MRSIILKDHYFNVNEIRERSCIAGSPINDRAFFIVYFNDESIIDRDFYIA